MAKKDKRIDEYIAKAQPFAKPILKHLRKLIHSACPEVEETIKWSFACFEYKGPLCSFAAFKQHCAFGFWKSALLNDPKKVLQERANKGGEAMGNLGKIKSLEDLPADAVIINLIKQAQKLNDDGIKLPPGNKVSEKEKKELEVPKELVSALKKNKKAKETFEAFSYSHKKEYVEWIQEAKTEVTRNKRITTAIEMLENGKSRNWKYEKKK